MIGLTLFLLISILLSWCGTKLQVPFAKQVFIFLLILILGLRHDVGKDYPTYELIYNVPDSVQANAVEPIWHLINYILRYLGFQARGFFFFTSVIVMVCFYKGIKNMSSHFYVSVTLFVLLGLYYESANIVRQYVAISILFCGFHYLVEGKIRKYIVCILFAALFHTSVLIIFPLILLSRFRYPPILLLAALAISFLFGNTILNTLINYVMPSLASLDLYQYGVDDFDAGVSSGILKLFYNLFACGILFLFMYRPPSKCAYFHILLNMVVIGMILYNTFYLFQPARRLYLYFFTYLIILIPYCAEYFKRTSQLIMIGITYLIFLLFLLKANVGIPYNFDVSFF